LSTQIIDPQYIKEFNGQECITMEGLMEYARNRGIVKSRTWIERFEPNIFIVNASIETQDKVLCQDFGYSGGGDLNSMLKARIEAKARVLCEFTGIPMPCFEVMSTENSSVPDTLKIISEPSEPSVPDLTAIKLETPLSPSTDLSALAFDLDELPSPATVTEQLQALQSPSITSVPEKPETPSAPKSKEEMDLINKTEFKLLRKLLKIEAAGAVDPIIKKWSMGHHATINDLSPDNIKGFNTFMRIMANEQLGKETVSAQIAEALQEAGVKK
jgi:hypothetical protein